MASRTRTFLFLLLLVVALGEARAARAGEVREAEGVVRWTAGLERLGREAVALLPPIRREVSQRLGWATQGDHTVVIVRNLDEMREASRARVPEWAVGVALSAEGLIVIRADLLAAGYGTSLESVLRHEWVHLAWGRRSGANRRVLPLWVEEGLAEEIGGGISVDAGAALDVAAAFDRLLPFGSLETSFPADARGADLAYKQSRSWVQYVVRTAGWDPVRQVLEDLAGWSAGSGVERELAFNDRLRARTGLTVGEWVASWKAALAEEARPWFHLLLRDFSGLILMVLAAIGAGFFLFLARRRRREIARLPDGEGLDPPSGPFEHR